MKISLNCNNCGEKFKFKSSAVTRPDLEIELGEYFRKQCTHCLITKEYHVNDSFAESSNSLIGTLAGLGLIIITTLFFLNQGVVTNFGFIIGAAILYASNHSMLTSNTTAFNSYRITRKEK